MPLVAVRSSPRLHKAVRPEAWRNQHSVADRSQSRVERELLAALNDLAGQSDEAQLLAAVDAKSVDAVLAAIPFDALQASLIPVIAILNDTLVAGADVAGQQLLDDLLTVQKAKARYRIRFDLTNPAARAWASQNAGALVTNITEATRDGVRRLVTEAFDLPGVPPRQLATLLQEAGVGLTARQAGALLKYQEALSAAGFTSDRIMSRLVRRAAKMRRYRATVIARHELLSASNNGQSQLWDQAANAGLIEPDQKRKWIITPDDRLCPYCSQMTGERAITGLKEPWDTPLGSVMVPQQIHVQCRCAQGLVVNLDVQATAHAAVANPSPALQALIPALATEAAVGAARSLLEGP